MGRVVELPDRGRLIVATDLQGNLRDFERIAALFDDAARADAGAVLVVTGDLVHGPEIPQSHWPDYLGSYYLADSAKLVLRARELAARHAGRVHYLLGNHEHAHVGGPVVSKFFANEADRLERLMGSEHAAAFRDWLQSWPLVAVARRAGVIMLHAAPNAPIESPAEIEEARLCGDDPHESYVDETLAEILWARTASSERARAFLRAFDDRLRVAVYGHDVAREGFAIDREPLLCVSTSFGCFDGDKLYLDWDLAEHAESARDLATRGLRPLWPKAPRVYRTVKLAGE